MKRRGIQYSYLGPSRPDRAVPSEEGVRHRREIAEIINDIDGPPPKGTRRLSEKAALRNTFSITVRRCAVAMEISSIITTSIDLRASQSSCDVSRLESKPLYFLRKRCKRDAPNTPGGSACRTRDGSALSHGAKASTTNLAT